MQTRGFCNWTANIHTGLGAGFSAACRHSRLLGSLLAPKRRSGARSSSRLMLQWHYVKTTSWWKWGSWVKAKGKQREEGGESCLEISPGEMPLCLSKHAGKVEGNRGVAGPTQKNWLYWLRSLSPTTDNQRESLLWSLGRLAQNPTACTGSMLFAVTMLEQPDSGVTASGSGLLRN